MKMVTAQDMSALDIREVMIEQHEDRAYVLAERDGITVYEIGCCRVAATNGNSVWEEADVVAFAELLESAGIIL